METELTKKLKKMSHSFKPLMQSNLRTIRYADEVSTKTGIVDSIRFEDYIQSREEYCMKISPKELDKNKSFYDKCDGDCKIEKLIFPNKNCKGCFFLVRETPVIDMCVTCYECKISYNDFKSKNGHNFHGNRNYYVVPENLVEKIDKLVPVDIGIIIYKENRNRLELYKECIFREITFEEKCFLLYNSLKKWCDNKQVIDK